MSPPAPVLLEVRPGSGRLCRTEHAVLFSPTPTDGWEQLVAAVHDPGAQGLAPVARVLAARQLDAPPLVYVTWRPQLAVLVFGDAELCTDQPSVPMLTGRGSQTWVEHSMLPFDGSVVLAAQAPDEPGTDLRAGVVPADGFRLTMELPRGALAEPAPRRESAPPVAEPSVSALPAVEPDPHRAAPPTTMPVDWRPPQPVQSPDEALSAIKAAAVIDDPDPGPAPPNAADPDLTVFVPAGDARRAPTHDQPEPERPLVDAVICSADHANPPGQATCRQCGTLLGADTPTRAVPQPVLGTLRLDDGRRVELSSDLLIGRRLRGGTDATSTLVIDHVEVSREHARVLLRGWELLVEDLGSRNGTYVVPPEGRDPVRVDPEVPVRIDPGTSVYLGSVRLVVDPIGS